MEESIRIPKSQEDTLPDKVEESVRIPQCQEETLSDKVEESVKVVQTKDGDLPDSIGSMEENLQAIAGRYPVEEQKLRMYSPLSFAYIGDSVFDLIIRTMVTTKGNTKPNQYHHQTIHYVNAAAQRQMMDRIKPYLTEQEQAIFRRGKNAKPATCAKNQSHHDYRIATGFEALIGYLYLTGQMHRIMELVGIGLEEMREGGSEFIKK